MGGTKLSLASLESLRLVFSYAGFTIKLIICKAFGDTFINANNAGRIRKESKSSAPFCFVCCAGTERQRARQLNPSLAGSQFYVSED